MAKKVKSAPSVLVLMSGGLDSSTLAAYLQEEGYLVHGLVMGYGQAHHLEISASKAVARDLGVASFGMVVIPDITFKGSKSPLNDPSQKMPHATYKELRETEGVSPTYVPFRNGLFISMATAYAMSRGIGAVAIASHADDAHNWAYPDCTPEFNDAMKSAISIGAYEKIQLLTPFEGFTKAEIVAEGLKLGVDYSKTWTCYTPGPLACGKCPSCVSRLEAFVVNDTPDPIKYASET